MDAVFRQSGGQDVKDATPAPSRHVLHSFCVALRFRLIHCGGSGVVLWEMVCCATRITIVDRYSTGTGTDT